MKRLLTTLLAVLTAASILNAAEPMSDGHQLTDLWAKYQEAKKADRPVKEAEILGQIKKEAFQKRLPVDFWDAATEYVYTVRRRDWKQGNSLREALQKEVADYDSPIITSFGCVNGADPTGMNCGSTFRSILFKAIPLPSTVA